MRKVVHMDRGRPQDSGGANVEICMDGSSGNDTAIPSPRMVLNAADPAKDAPPDLSRTDKGAAALPEPLRRELRELGLL